VSTVNHPYKEVSPFSRAKSQNPPLIIGDCPEIVPQIVLAGQRSGLNPSTSDFRRQTGLPA
jgi:hypothetical protein